MDIFITWMMYVLYMGYTTVNIGNEYLIKLGKLATNDKRSKTAELHYLIDCELEKLEVKA